MPDPSILFWTIVALLDLYAAGLAIFRHRGVEATLAWLLAIIAVPGVGAVAYILLSTPGIKRTTRRKIDAKVTVRESAGGVGARIAPTAESVLEPPVGSLLRLASDLTGLPATGGNAVELLAEDERAFERIEQSIAAAEKAVWAEYYIIKRDETGRRFLDLLADRARAGVDVRLLFDAVGSLGLDPDKLAAIRAAGGHVESFLPVNPLRRRWAVHLRNHRKLIVVDGATGFTGGMNVGDEYSGRARRRGEVHFRDSHLAVRGPAVADMALTFAEDWLFATEEELPLPPRPSSIDGADARVAVVTSGPDQKDNAAGLVYFAAVAAAEKSVFLTTPYFVPDAPLIRALKTAAHRGVDVRLLVPRRPDVALVGAVARTYYPKLLRSGVRVFEYTRSMLHAKTLVVDGRLAIVGSANADIRSFKLNFEIGALVDDTALASVLEARFGDDLEGSEEVTAETIALVGPAARLRDGVARLLSPLL